LLLPGKGQRMRHSLTLQSEDAEAKTSESSFNPLMSKYFENHQPSADVNVNSTFKILKGTGNKDKRRGMKLFDLPKAVMQSSWICATTSRRQQSI
jgi:hypothetical protein